MSITKLQANMIRKIAESEYNILNGRAPSTLDDVGEIWASAIIMTAEDKGVFTSLLNAGLVHHWGAGSSDAVVQLSEAGFSAYKSI